MASLCKQCVCVLYSAHYNVTHISYLTVISVSLGLPQVQYIHTRTYVGLLQVQYMHIYMHFYPICTSVQIIATYVTPINTHLAGTLIFIVMESVSAH